LPVIFTLAAVADEVAVGDRAARIAVDGDDAVPDLEAVRRRVELRAGELQQRLPPFGGGGAHLRPVVLDRPASRRRSLVGRHVGVDGGGRDLAHREVKLLGGDLQQPRGGALAQFDLADEQRRGVVRVHGDPRVDESGVWRGRGGRRRDGVQQRAGERAGDGEADNEGAALQEVAARERRMRECSVRGGHRRSSAIIRDASWMAFMMRG
jgi:hypothetical protein